MAKRLNVAICEDSQEDSRLLAGYIKKNHADVRVDKFESGEAFLESYQKGKYHLVFLDVYMGGMTGIDIAAAIRESGDGVPIAFITRSRDHALEANRHRSIHYIEKPVTADSVAHTLSIADAVRERSKKEVLTVTDDSRRTLDVPHDDICHAEVVNQRCTVYLTDGRKIGLGTSMTISALDTLLPKPRFFRCHRSYIINLDHVERVDSELLVFIMASGGRAYIRRGKLKAYEAAVNEWLLEKARKDGL